jgi:hypothetical protein
MTKAAFDFARSASMTEMSRVIAPLAYWVDFAGRMKPDPGGFYSFDAVGDENPDDFEGGRLAYHKGQFDRAIRLIDRAIQKRGESETRLFWLAMAYMRKAEADNCLSPMMNMPKHAMHMGGYCTLPLVHFHQQAESARTAARLFGKLLDRYDPGNGLYRWLLNFNYMAVNGYPQDVPPQHLIKSQFIEAFYGPAKQAVESQFADLTFEDRAGDLGVDTYGTGRGVAVEDFDNDGYLDIVTGGAFETLHYYKNEGGKTFSDRSEQTGLAAIRQPFFVSAVDFDNDGWMDLFVSRMLGPTYVLLRNNRHGGFTDVTAESGLLEGPLAAQLSSGWIHAWADVNNDGYLDLFLAQMSMKVPILHGVLSKPRMDSKLFINRKGRFVDKTREYGLSDVVHDSYFIGAAFGDYDGDGYPDLFLSSPLYHTSALLRNVAGTRFEKTGLIDRKEGGFSAAFVDVNHDGRLDIFQGGFANARTSAEGMVLGKPAAAGHSTLFVQTAEGKFQEHDEFFNAPMATMGASFGDLNNDGCYDFYLGAGNPESWFVLPHLMYLGKAKGTQCLIENTNISMLNGFGSVQKGHGIVFFDFDGDGKQDIYSSLGGMWPSDRWFNQFFVNTSKLTNTWTKIRLRGRQTNYFGVGATIKVTALNPAGEQIVRYALMDQKTGLGSGPYLAQVGLMDADRIKEVEVYWPVSRCRRIYPAELKKLNILDEAAGAAVNR